MKLVKIFGVVMAAHAAAFMFIFAIPGCRSGKKPAQPAAAPEIGGVPVVAAESSPDSLNAAPAAPTEVAVRFSPTRPGSAAAAEVTAPTTYTVVKGDNLWSIAKKHGVTVKQLAAANKITTDTTLKLGQKLVLPSAAPAAAAAAPSTPAPAAPAAPATSTVTHTVKSGESLAVIAKRYGVRVGEIATANNIADPAKLRVGQTLKVPGAKSGAASTAAKAPASKPAAPAPAAKPAAPAPAPAPQPEAPAPQPEPAPAPIEPASPIEAAPAVPGNGNPLITPAGTPTDAPVIPIQESGAPSF